MIGYRTADLMDLTFEYWRWRAEVVMKLLFPWASPVDRVNRKPNVVLIDDPNALYGVRPAGEEDQDNPFFWPGLIDYYETRRIHHLSDPESAEEELWGYLYPS